MYVKIFQFSTLLIMVLLIGCTQSEEKVLQTAEQNATDIFYDDKRIEVNYIDDSMSFYLPSNLEVVEADKNNVVLEGNDHTYIVFYNDLERATSRFHYESVSDGSALLNTALETDDQFGYLRIIDEGSEDGYELQAGIGGVKITTYTMLKQIPTEAEELMKIAKSMIESSM